MEMLNFFNVASNRRFNTAKCFLAMLAGTLLLSGCATPKPPPNALESAERAIDAAILEGAEQHAPVELRFARERLAEAHKGMERKSYEKAFYLIDQSEINSELAIEKSREAKVRAALADQIRQNEVLIEDFNRTYGEKP
jgi:hypothetical protein